MVTIGITTYNRKALLERMASSLYASDLSIPHHIRVYDDASTELDETILRELFPDVETMHIQPYNMGADANLRYMYEDFLQSDDDYLFNADSDLIFRRDWLNMLMRVVSYTDGVISAFNAHTHSVIGEVEMCGTGLVQKSDLGSAGTLFKRDLVVSIVEKLKEKTSYGFDWKWSVALKQEGKKLLSLKNSVVQHIGLEGFNSDMSKFDYGYGFFIDSVENGQILNDTVMDCVSGKKDHSPKMRKYSLFPFDQIQKGSKIIIYGAGKYGNDYYKQVEMSGLYDLLAIADREKKGNGIIPPQTISEYNFDYVVIGVGRPDLEKEIIDYLIEIGVGREKIVSGCGDRVICV